MCFVVAEESYIKTKGGMERLSKVSRGQFTFDLLWHVSAIGPLLYEFLLLFQFIFLNRQTSDNH